MDITINGVHLVLCEITGNAGDEHGVASLKVPVEVPDLQTALNLDWVAVAEAVGINAAGVLCKGRPLTQQDNGRYIVSFEYEGFARQDLPGIDPKENETTYEFDGDMAESPFGENPNFQALKDEFGWDTDEKAFSEFKPLSFDDQAFNALNAATATGTDVPEVPSPLYQAEGWLKASGTFTKTYAVSQVSPTVYANIGTIVAYPPGGENINLPYFKSRNWLKLAPQVRLSGKAILITERHKLSGPGGYIEPVYNFDQLPQA